jgi:monoamine oxidase
MVRSACVVGAGFAGLAAAEALSLAGVRVTVLEARDRVGGRVWSRTLENGAVIEMGAEFVTDGYTLLPGVVERLGLSLAAMGMSFNLRQPRGGAGTDARQLALAVERVAAALERGDGEGLSAMQVLKRLPIDPGARELIACRLQVSYAHPATAIAAEAVRDVAHLFVPSEARRIAGGNQRLALRLAESLDVRLSTPVRSIAATARGYRINGELDVDTVVVAAPAPALDAVDFTPRLPGWKRAALERVAYGAAAKLAVPLAATAPPSSVLSVPEHFWTWTALAGDAVAPVVAAFAGSAPAVEALDVDSGPARYLERVEALRPDLEMDAEGAVLATWPEGAYSTREPGRPAGDDELLARAVGGIAFAGEHTAGEWFATMEGALRSGVRAAHDLLPVRSAGREARTAQPR